jgi:MerR family transcriptional regulator, copper efflux regulator
MLISEFARATGLSVDTVRFYVSKGLLHPKATAKGGSKPYQIFNQDHIETARAIRVGQSIGFTLKEIAELGEEYRAAAISPKRSIEVMESQIVKLEEKSKQLDSMIAFLRAKIIWQKGNREGPLPSLRRPRN